MTTRHWPQYDIIMLPACRQAASCLNLMYNVKIHILSIKKHKEREQKTAYLCHVGKWIP